MHEPRSPPSRPRRARTGCLSCRKRRRKCDETKPTCLNCQARSVACVYPGADLRFPTQSASQTDDSGLAKPTGPKAFTFVNEGASKSEADINANFNRPLSNMFAPATHDHQIGVRGSVVTQSPEGIREGANQGFDSSTTQARRSKSASFTLHSVEDSSAEVDAKSSIERFCYITAPWIEAGNTRARFASYIMRLAQDHPAVMSAILAFTSGPAEREATAESRDFAGWANHSNEFAYRVSKGLTTINTFLKCSPRRWESLWPTIMPDTEGVSRTLDEPLRTIAQMYSRFDLALAIFSRSAPLTSSSFYLSATSPTTTRMMETPEVVQQRCLGYLASCLQLIHGNAPLTNPNPSPNAIGASFSSQWSLLWSDSQKWFKNRSLTQQPILDVSSMEASKLDPSHSSSFPIQIYTNVAALQSNVVYHMTCILLLARKPRLLKLTPTEQQMVTSQAWHAQQIAGAAMSNDFAEQWDPIFIVALLHIAKSMTHRAQQQTLVSRFHRIAASTGIPMDEEIERLQTEWDVVRSGGTTSGT